MSRTFLLAFCPVALALAFLRADASDEVFILKSGGRIEGELLNTDRQRGQPYQVRTEDGVRLALAEAAVQRVIVKTDVDKQYEALLPTLANTVESQWGMAEWCKEAGLTEQRKKHLQAVVALDPDHAEARKALGYQRYGKSWLTPEEHMQSIGYIRYKGTWRLRQEIEIDSRETQYELAVKKFRKDIRLWLDQVTNGGRRADEAERNLNAIVEPEAAPALTEIVGDPQWSKQVRQRCLAILAKLPPRLATATLFKVAMTDPDPSLQDGCIEELKRQGTHSVLPLFLAELKSKDNGRVNRAADCLGRLGDKSATLPLINALITEHKFLIQQGNAPPGGMSATFSPNGGPGAGGMAMGGKPQLIKQQLKNSAVRNALTMLHPGTNFQYDMDAWRKWYVQSQTTSAVDLRRDE
jgi:hypothetical protein